MTIKTALSIVQEFRRGINEDAPSALFNSTDPDEQQMLEHLNQVCEYLRSNGPFRSQIRKHSFTATSSATEFTLPQDFWEAMSSTYYNESSQYPLFGPISDAEFVAYKERGYATPYEYVWRIVGFGATLSSVDGRVFEIYPAGAGDTLSFEYISANLYLPAAWFASQDTDLHDRLAADTDYCAFDPDLVKLGLEWKYRGATSQDQNAIQRAKDEFDNRITSSRFRFQGARAGRFGSNRRRRWYPIQEKNWSFS